MVATRYEDAAGRRGRRPSEGKVVRGGESVQSGIEGTQFRRDPGNQQEMSIGYGLSNVCD